MDDALETAKAAVGGVAAIAKAFGDLSPQAVSQWKRVPADRAIRLEAISGVSRHKLRPDVFGPEPCTRHGEAA